MSSPVKRRAAKRIKRRQVEATIEGGDFDGWSITIWADFSARQLADLQYGDVARILGFLQAVTIDHNLPDSDTGELADDLGTVDYGGLLKVAEAALDAISRLPPR